MYKEYNCSHYGPTYYNQEEFHISDVIFDVSLLDEIVDFCRQKRIENIFTMHVFPDSIRKKYPDINFFYKEQHVLGDGWKHLKQTNTHPPINIKNFICSFNGSEEVGRQFFVSVLKKMQMFNPHYCSKNFSTNRDTVDGNVSLLSNNPNLHRKLIVLDENKEKFYDKFISFNYNKYDHYKNTNYLMNKISESFLNLVCESYATGNLVAITEKCLHSIVCRGLFLCYAQKGWHKLFNNCYGFRNYTKIFNYNFDIVENPVERLIELVTMVQKFANLSPNDWNDLYELQKDDIDYNHEHYFSNSYINCIRKYENNLNAKKY